MQSQKSLSSASAILLSAAFLLFVYPASSLAETSISGFPLGGQMPDHFDVRSERSKGTIPLGRDLFVDLTDNYFDYVGIPVDNRRRIEGLIFVKRYKISVFDLKAKSSLIRGDLSLLVQSLEKKYGAFSGDAVARLAAVELNTPWLQAIKVTSINTDTGNNDIAALAITVNAKAFDLAAPEAERDVAVLLWYVGQGWGKLINESGGNIFEAF